MACTASILFCFGALATAPATHADVARVEFHDAERPELRGELQELTSDVAILEIGSAASLDTLSLADVFSIETYAGRTSKLNNTIIGVFLGTLAGMVVGALTADCPDDDCFGPPQEVFIGGGVGLFVGMGVGAIPTPTWKPVYLSPEATTRRERYRAWK